MQYPTRQHWSIYALLFALLVFLTPRSGAYFDLDYWERWAVYIFRHGLGNTYLYDDNNYPPLYQYLLWVYAKVTGSEAKLSHYRSFLKVLVLPFDFAGAILAVRVFGRGDANQRFLASLLLLLNVGYVYNTVVWVQTDALFSFFVFWAVVLALRERVAASVVAYVLAFSAKTQAIIFLPPLLLLWGLLWWRAPRTLLTSVGASAVVLLLVLAPFIWGGAQNTLPRIWYVVTHGADFYPYVTMNAYNWWTFWRWEAYTPDTLHYGALTYKQWGLLGFLTASGVLLLPAAVAAWRRLRLRAAFSPADAAPLLLTFGLVPIAFAYFNTQMHERYWHPAFLFLASYGLLTGRHALFGIFSVAYFLNLESVLHSLNLIKYGTALFSPALVGSLFSLILLVGTGLLYRAARDLPGWWQRAPGADASPTRP